MLKSIGQFLTGLFGGGSWAIFLLATVLIGGLWLERESMKASLKEQKAEIAALKGQNESATKTIQNMAATQTRRNAAQQQLNTTEGKINALPQTSLCANSEPVRIVLDSLRDEQNAAANNPK